mgnify:CR=1 FL=1
MKKTLIVAAFTCFAGAAFAQGYSDHDGVKSFTQEPCAGVFDTLEAEPDIMNGPEAFGAALGEMGMTWGFILGYDTARGGLHEGDKTTLARLREECEAAPEKTAFEILESF